MWLCQPRLSSVWLCQHLVRRGRANLTLHIWFEWMFVGGRVAVPGIRQSVAVPALVKSTDLDLTLHHDNCCPDSDSHLLRALVPSVGDVSSTFRFDGL